MGLLKKAPPAVPAPQRKHVQLKLPPAQPPTRYDDDDDTTYAELVRRYSSATHRLLMALDSSDLFNEQTMNVRCPACGADDKLEIARSYDPQIVEARCSAGCAKLTDAIQRAIVEYEADEADKALDDAMRPSARLTEAAPQRWEVPMLAPACALTLLRGVSGTGKSWIIAYAAVCKALGLPFFGHPVERGRVLLAFLESQDINEPRIDLLVRGMGRTMADLDGWLDLWEVGLPFRSDDRACRDHLADRVRKRLRKRKYAVLFFDNTTRMRTTRSQSAENDSSILSAVLEPLADLAQTGMMDCVQVTPKESRPAIVVLDHDRGSSAAEQNADYVVAVTRSGSSEDPDATTTLQLSRGCRVFCEDMPIRVQFHGVGPHPVTARVVGDDDEAEDDDRLGVIVGAVRAEPGSGINAISRATGLTNKRDLGRDLETLVAAGRLTVDDRKKYRVAE